MDVDYVLGTHDEEVARLGLQHEVWRERVLNAWRRAGLAPGQTALDMGAGPGHAALDLARIVGPAGKVIAVERSRRFLDALDEAARGTGTTNIEALERDAAEDFGEAIADFAWCRWLLCFLTEPQRAVANIARALKPGGTAVFHEYANYGTWRMLPPDQDLDRFRDLVVRSWRDAGGEPDIGAELPRLLVAEGFKLVEVRPLIDIVGPEDFAWQWPASFMATNAKRLHELGYATESDVDRFSTLLEQRGAEQRMITPLVIEVIATPPEP